MADRIPYNSKYCKEVNCSLRSGNKCIVLACARVGGDKWAAYFTEHGHLADGDKIDA